jgi:hypothetical protein
MVNKEMQVKSDEEIRAMSDGDFYHYMLDKDHTHWAKWANVMGKLNLNQEDEHVLSAWFASAQMAVIDREHAGYIRARLDSETKDEA